MEIHRSKSYLSQSGTFQHGEPEDWEPCQGDVADTNIVECEATVYGGSYFTLKVWIPHGKMLTIQQSKIGREMRKTMFSYTKLLGLRYM